MSSAEVAKNVLAKNDNLGWGDFWGEIPQIFAVDSKHLIAVKLSNISQNLVGLDSVAFVWEARK